MATVDKNGGLKKSEKARLTGIFPAGRGLFLFAFIALVLLSTSGCVGGTASLPTGFSPPAGERIIGGVPFYPDDRNQCGPASLAGLLNFYGGNLTVDEISTRVYRPDLKGTVSLDLVLFARQQGFAAEWSSGSIDDIISSIDDGRPMVVMVDHGISRIRQSHFMVVVGYRTEGIIVNSGLDKKLVIPWGRFFHTWERTHGWVMRIKK